MFLITFCAETIPSFNVILNLMGGTTIALTSAIMPCVFYLCLNAIKNEKKYNTKNVKFQANLVKMWDFIFYLKKLVLKRKLLFAY